MSCCNKPKLYLFFQSAVEQVCRLARTLPSPHESAHCVLVAEGCPGRTTVMVKLASHLCGYAVYQINPSPMTSATEYKMDMFKADLVQGYTRAGTKVLRRTGVFFLHFGWCSISMIVSVTTLTQPPILMWHSIHIITFEFKWVPLIPNQLNQCYLT